MDQRQDSRAEFHVAPNRTFRHEMSLVTRECVTNGCEMTGCPAAKDDQYGCSCDTDKDSGFCRFKDVRSVSTDTYLCESV